jgi:hypothetical protein
MKKILIGILVLVAVVLGGVYFVSANIDSIVEAAIEKYGTASTRTPVRLDSVKIALASGQATLGGLSVGSPEGFEAPKSLSIGNISVKLDTASVTGTGPIVIKDISIDKPEVTYEINEKGQSNLQTIVRNTQSYASSLSGKGPKLEKKAVEAESGKETGRKIIIESLTVRDGLVAFSQPLAKDKQYSAKLPVIHLTNMGKADQGATPAEVAQEILAAITTASSQVASEGLAKELGSKIEAVTGGKVDESVQKMGTDAINGLFGK